MRKDEINKCLRRTAAAKLNSSPSRRLDKGGTRRGMRYPGRGVTSCDNSKSRRHDQESNPADCIPFQDPPAIRRT